MTGIQSITWSLWQRNRKLAFAVGGATGLYVIFIGIIGHFVQTSPWVAIPMAVLVGVAYLAIVAAFMFHDADVAAKGSAYPTYMFTLPVRTYQLALVPLALGSLVAFTLGLIVMYSTRFAGAQVMIFLPPMMLVSILAYLQATFWYPTGFPYSKLLLTLLGITAISLFIGISLEEKMSEEAVCLGLALTTLLCYLVSYRGIAKARKGDTQFIRVRSIEIAEEPTIVAEPKAVRWLKPFTSAGAAQRWYEWRQHGLVMPTIVVILFVLFYIPMYWNTTYSPVSIFGHDAEGRMSHIPTYIHSFLPMMLGLIPFVAWMVGSGARRSDVKHDERTFMLFFGVRPMSDGGLVSQKYWAALKSSLVTWALVPVCLLPTLVMKGGFFNPDINGPHNELRGSVTVAVLPSFDLPMWSAIQQGLTPTLVYYGFGITVLLIALTWRNYAVGYWTELSGNIWLRNGYPIFLLFGSLTVGGVIKTLPEQIAREWLTFERINLVLWLIIGIRILIAGWLLRRILASQLLSVKTLMKGFAAYLTVVGLLVAWVLSVTPDFRQAMVEAHVATPGVAVGIHVAAILFLVPIVRILLAPIMLHVNRHRVS